MKDLSKRNRRNKVKGREFQGKIAKLFRNFYPMAHNTGVRQARAQCDVENTTFWIECKSGKKPSITGAYKQALEDSSLEDDARPILVIAHHERFYKGSSEDTVTMSLELFEIFLRKANKNET